MQDSVFIRGAVPMTKSEIRAVSLAKLDLTPGAVFCDVGAGTGSVAVEAARQLCRMEAEVMPLRREKSQVYAIEKEEEGVLLIKKNREKWVPHYGQFSVIHGRAPEVLTALPAPTHVFIGGSNGALSGIVQVVLEKNPRARLVINAVTLETLSACIELLHKFSFASYEIVQVAVTHLEPRGSYHMPKALNPVYIIFLQGGSHGDGIGNRD